MKLSPFIRAFCIFISFLCAVKLMCLCGGPALGNSNFKLDGCYFNDLWYSCPCTTLTCFFSSACFVLLCITIVSVMPLTLGWKDDLFAEVSFPPAILKNHVDRAVLNILCCWMLWSATVNCGCSILGA